MPQPYTRSSKRNLGQNSVARILPCKKLDIADPIKWLALGWQDLTRAPRISLFFGVFFVIAPWSIVYLVSLTGWYLVIFPALIGFMLIGPFLAAGLYDVSREFSKGRHPQLLHCVKAINRNAINEWAFGFLLMVIMVFWLKLASIIHTVYPPYLNENLHNLMPFLLVGTIVGISFTTLVFCISVFTQPILMARQVDLATAVLTSMNTVWQNKLPMFIWACTICMSVGIGFVTGFIGFMLLMPLIGYASWHGYRDALENVADLA
ncbi:DUF2189 domain-containing protein [Neptunicella sp. SCSIO 80796]|uniref:DUF2189 domain-containing protein n=1 Tax=Neptunicella plasticusilytica TaxID=3117012 RepID=UPI003A4E1AB7